MKATYRRVMTTYWTDPDIRRACRTPEAHMVLLYLFTGPDSTLSGLYWQPLEDIAHRTRIELDTVRELIATFCEKGFLAYDHTTEEVFVRAAIQHQIGTEYKPNDNRWRAVMRDIANTHSDALVAAIVENYGWVDWPEEVKTRAEGASEGLQPSNHAANGGGGEPVETRGSEAKHALTHVSTHTKTEEETTGILDTGEGEPDAAALIRRLPSAARDVLSAIVSDKQRKGAASTLAVRFLAPNDDGMLDESVRGLSFEKRVALVGAALVEFHGESDKWNARHFAGFVRRLRKAPKPGTEAAAVHAKGEPGTGYKPLPTYTEEAPPELTRIDARALLESFGVSAPRGEA